MTKLAPQPPAPEVRDRPAGSRVWHQMTNAVAWAERPGPCIVRGEGAYFWDADGRRIIDGNSGLQNVNIGHGRRDMAAAAAAQIEQLEYFPVYNGTHPPVEELADALHAKLPHFERFLFLNSGSEASEVTIKLLREYWLLRGEPQRQVLLSRLNSYHGATLGALAPTGRAKGALRQPFEPFLMESHNLSDPTLLDGETEDEGVARLLAELRATIERCGPERIMGLFAEPVQQQDAPVPPAGYFRGLREICDEYEIPLVADEVITGFGRTGAWFGIEHFGITPDIAVLGKGLASGYAPISAIGVSERVLAPFEAESGALFHHLSTTAGHPVACALALENIRILEREDLIVRARTSGEALRRMLREAFDGRSYVAGVTGLGMLSSVVFHPDQVELGLAANAELRAGCLERGAYLRVDGQIWFIPPLTIELDALERLTAIAVSAADAWVSKGGRR